MNFPTNKDGMVFITGPRGGGVVFDGRERLEVKPVRTGVTIVETNASGDEFIAFYSSPGLKLSQLELDQIYEQMMADL